MKKVKSKLLPILLKQSHLLLYICFRSHQTAWQRIFYSLKWQNTHTVKVCVVSCHATKWNRFTVQTKWHKILCDRQVIPCLGTDSKEKSMRQYLFQSTMLLFWLQNEILTLFYSLDTWLLLGKYIFITPKCRLLNNRQVRDFKSKSVKNGLRNKNFQKSEFYLSEHWKEY